jgi:aspartyl/asparaginyl beta-hydroxylase (cupin superfamily)
MSAMSPTLEGLEAAVRADPTDPVLWLQLGFLRQRDGQSLQSLQAWFQAVSRARLARQWIDPSSTPPAWADQVLYAIEQVKRRRREPYFGSYETLRQQHGAQPLARVDRALSHHLREWRSDAIDPRQKPRFFYFPDLPNLPYLDPMSQPWAPQLLEAYPAIRDEALKVMQEDQGVEDFVRIKEGDRIENYLGGKNPAWEAFFFFRHGKRYDDNHLRCPATSRALESIKLCRIEGHAPEICFSFLTPGTHLLPHYGVTNVRVVMHLPLLVPRECALNVIDAREHHWREGELMMFDDTFLHEAWNRSDSVRVILLMDCWNPALSAVERQAMTMLIETIAAWHRSARASA